MRRIYWRETKWDMEDRKKTCNIPGNRQGLSGSDCGRGEEGEGWYKRKGTKQVDLETVRK